MGFASWYDPWFVASGERYHKHKFTCAIRNRDFGKYYLVCNLDNNKCVVVKHNDFGPSLELFKRGRIIDLSRYAFSKVADLKKGLMRVRTGEIYAGQVDQ
ncbi:MAG: septal ring lytic transglycosylase RlpA family protein [Candidatus Omnitrophica bacterium]|nr:septal ring lytic transglycosylase RlpA family protein [Candidatus Omnitrophota bacterium]